jgi:hypothetical protein
VYAKRVRRDASAARWREYAVKCVSRDVLREQTYVRNIQQEIAAMRGVASHAVTRLLSVCESKTHVYLVLEYSARGDLHSHIRHYGSMSASSARFVAAEMVRGLQALHTAGVSRCATALLYFPLGLHAQKKKKKKQRCYRTAFVKPSANSRAVPLLRVQLLDMLHIVLTDLVQPIKFRERAHPRHFFLSRMQLLRMHFLPFF